MEKGKENEAKELEERKKELIAELEKIELEEKKKELLKQLEDKPRKLNKVEVKTIADATEQLFAVHYINIGYNFIESDINIFTYYANKNKFEFKLPIQCDLDYCYSIVQGIIHTARMLRYEQRTLSTYLLRVNIDIKNYYFNVKPINDENNKELEKDLLKIVSLFADAKAMMQFLKIVFELLNIDKTKYKDVVIKSQLKEAKYKQYLNLSLVEYLNDNAFWNDIFTKFEEVKTFLFSDNNKVFNKIINDLKINNLELVFEQNDTKSNIAYFMQTLKYIDKELLDNLSDIQEELAEHSNKKDVETIKKYVLNYNTNDFLAMSLNYLNTLTDYYREYITLKGASNGKEK